MSSSALIRWGGLVAMLGGTLWTIATVVHASEPRGCIAEECASRPMRETATLVQAIFFGGDFPLMPHFVVPGLLALVVGFLLAGLAILRSGAVPRWVAVLVIAGALAMLGANEQTARVLLMIPFGVAWVAVGYVLWSGAGAPTGRPAARVR